MELFNCKLFKNTRIDISEIEVKTFPNNYTIELEGETSQYLGVLLEGRIHVKTYSLGGKDFTINTINPGMIYGDILIFGSKTRSFPGNLVTKGFTKVAIIPNKDIKNYLIHDRDFLYNFLEILSDKVYEFNANSKMLSQDSVRDKILFYLYQQKRIQMNNKIQLNMTKEELANQLFMQRPSLSRELIKMKNEGLITYDRWTITLKIK